MRGEGEDFGQGKGREEEWWTSSASEGKVKNFIFMVRQQRGLTPMICTMRLDESEGIHLHVCEPSIRPPL